MMGKSDPLMRDALETVLEWLSPARKEELLGRLERNGVPGPIIGQLRKRLPEGEYRGPQDVLSALRRGL